MLLGEEYSEMTRGQVLLKAGMPEIKSQKGIPPVKSNNTSIKAPLHKILSVISFLNCG